MRPLIPLNRKQDGDDSDDSHCHHDPESNHAEMRPSRGTCGRTTSRATVSASESVPVRSPSASIRPTNRSVLRLPGAPGANGHPPRPPTAESKVRTPSSRARSALASAVPEVSWKCNANCSIGTDDRAARKASLTESGVAVPIVSARQTSSHPSRSSRSATWITSLTLTAPE